MKSQSFCALPWCGASFGEPLHSREFRVDGKMVSFSYPEQIEMHDIVRRSQGGDPEDLDNNVPLCKECHTKHHDGRLNLIFQKRGSGLPPLVREPITYRWRECVAENEHADPIPQEASEEAGATLWEIQQSILDLHNSSSTVDYYEGKLLLELRGVFQHEYGTREGNNRLAEWVLETFHLKNTAAARTFITAHTAYSLLPETQAVTSLGVTRGYRVAKAVKTCKKQLKEVLYDEAAMSVEDFCAIYFDTVPTAEKEKCVCPECGKLHDKAVTNG